MSTLKAPRTKAPRTNGPRTQVERSERTQKKLIDATIDIIISEGISRVRVQKIAQRAGVSSGALQHHFNTKEDLLYQAHDRIFYDVTVPLDIDGSRKSLRERCRSAVETYWNIYSQSSYRATLEILLYSRVEPELRRRVDQHQKETIARGLRLFERLFVGYGLSRGTLEDMLLYTLSHLRGLSVQCLFELAPRQVGRQLDIAEQTLCDMVEAARSPAVADESGPP